MIKTDAKKLNEPSYQKGERIFKALRPILESIGAESLAETRNWPKAMNLFGKISANKLKLSEQNNKSNLFKIVTDNNRWRIFNYVMNCATKNEDCYKENIVDQPWNVASSKTVYKIVDEFIDCGLFVNDGRCNISGNEQKTDNRKRNLKPSEAAVVEYLDYAIADLVTTMDLIKEYTKIKIEFN